MHQFYDNDLNRYVTIDADSVAQYVGHRFAKQNGDGFTAVTLDSYEISVEYEAAYGIISALHYNIIVEGMISTDFMLLTQEKHGFDIAMRAALKSASGNDFANARYYDSAGYFFDAAVGRDITIIPEQSRVRLAASGGFLCWQTDNGRQNDAVMYGAMLAFTKDRFNVDAALGGYVGWEGDGDRPMTIKTNLSWAFNRLSLVLHHQSGINDWPYHQFRIGVTYSFGQL
jgi:hypothetical protein